MVKRGKNNYLHRAYILVLGFFFPGAILSWYMLSPINSPIESEEAEAQRGYLTCPVHLAGICGRAVIPTEAFVLQSLF